MGKMGKMGKIIRKNEDIDQTKSSFKTTNITIEDKHRQIRYSW